MVTQQQAAYRRLRFYRLHIIRWFEIETGRWTPVFVSGAAPTGGAAMCRVIRQYPVCLN